MSQSTVKYEWYQTSGSVTLSLLKRGVSDVDCVVGFVGPCLQVTIKDELVFSAELYDQVDSSKISLICKQARVDVTLPKLSGTHWPSLTNSKASIKYAETSRPKPNWDELTKDVEKEEAEAEDGVDKFFRTIYKDATDETKKAMIKSFTESQGTVLSTNWGEVGKKKIDVSPPDNMEFKKYDS